MNKYSSLLDLKEKIEEKTGIPSQEQVFIFNAYKLYNDKKSLVDNGIVDYSRVHLIKEVYV